MGRRGYKEEETMQVTCRKLEYRGWPPLPAPNLQQVKPAECQTLCRTSLGPPDRLRSPPYCIGRKETLAAKARSSPWLMVRHHLQSAYLTAPSRDHGNVVTQKLGPCSNGARSFNLKPNQLHPKQNLSPAFSTELPRSTNSCMCRYSNAHGQIWQSTKLTPCCYFQVDEKFLERF